MGRVVLAVIDVQVGSLKPEMEDLPQRISNFVGEWRARGGDVVFFRYVNFPGSPCERFLDWTEMHSPPETDLCSELLVHVTRSFEKSVYTAATPEFLAEMEKEGWDTVVCCGVDTAACIQKTALVLFDRGKRPFVISDLCASGAGAEAHRAALIALNRAIGLRQIGSKEEALELLPVRSTS